MTKQQKLAAILGACLLTLTLSCTKEKTKCGCDSPSAELFKNRTGTGKLTYAADRKMYVIIETAPDGIMTTSCYICNPSQEVIDLYKKSPSGNLRVAFKGDIKDLCNPPYDIPEHGHCLIKLSEIQETETL